MKKRRSRSRFQPEGFSGYTEFRYGPKRKVTLAPILTGERRQHVVNRVIDALKDWHISPFEHEADAVHGIRQGFCLDGHSHARAEAEARAIVATGLRIIGAKRPTWEEGQPEYTEPIENCAHCRGPLDIYRLKSRFCSDICARAFVQRRNNHAMEVGEVTLAKARRLIYREHEPARICDHCGASFRPMHGATKGRFCSKQCMYAHRDDERARVHEKTCEWCRAPFVAKTARARFCSQSCQTMESRMRRNAPDAPKTISPPVFDYVFRIAA